MTVSWWFCSGLYCSYFIDCFFHHSVYTTCLKMWLWSHILFLYFRSSLSAVFPNLQSPFHSYLPWTSSYIYLSNYFDLDNSIFPKMQFILGNYHNLSESEWRLPFPNQSFFYSYYPLTINLITLLFLWNRLYIFSSPSPSVYRFCIYFEVIFNNICLNSSKKV